MTNTTQSESGPLKIVPSDLLQELAIYLKGHAVQNAEALGLLLRLQQVLAPPPTKAQNAPNTYTPHSERTMREIFQAAFKVEKGPVQLCISYPLSDEAPGGCANFYTQYCNEHPEAKGRPVDLILPNPNNSLGDLTPLSIINPQGLEIETNEPISRWYDSNNLQTLKTNSPIPDATLAAIAAHSPKLSKLVLLQAGQLTDTGVEILTQLPNLKELQIYNHHFSPETLEMLSKLPTLKNYAIHGFGGSVTSESTAKLGSVEPRASNVQSNIEPKTEITP